VYKFVFKRKKNVDDNLCVGRLKQNQFSLNL